MQTHHERPPNAPRTLPERPPNAPQTDPEISKISESSSMHTVCSMYVAVLTGNVSLQQNACFCMHFACFSDMLSMFRRFRKFQYTVFTMKLL